MSSVKFHRVSGSFVVALACLLASAEAARAGWQTLLSESFADDPVAAGRATLSGTDAADRFTHNGGSSSLTAAYDTHEPTAKLNWLAGRTLTADDTFRYTVDFTFDSLTAAGTQIAFGLINSQTTGSDRPGGTHDESIAAFDAVTVDYFPEVTTFGGPSLATSLNESDEGQGYLATFDDDFNIVSPGAINFPFGAESDMGGETLALNTMLTADVTYNAATRSATLRMLVDGEPLEINLTGEGGTGGPDGDTTTIQTSLKSEEYGFSVDSFALTLWQDTWGDETDPATVADVTFHGFELSVVPEPHAAALLAIGSAILLTRRGRRPHTAGR